MSHLRLSVLFGMGALASPSAALAQSNADAATIAELVVTGTRLPRSEATANSPVTRLEGEAIRASGMLTLDQALNRLPQVSPTFSSAANNPSANGAAYVDLRGLGENRNLVLLDGRRVVGANASNSVDLNTVPNALIERVEIVTGGASAVYGADAVAGVVNVILRRDFRGLQASGRTLVSDRGDGREHELGLALGGQLGPLRLSAALGWSEREEIGKGERRFSAQAGGVSGFLPGGSWQPPASNAPAPAAVNTVFARYGAAAGTVPARGGFAGFAFNTDGTLIGTGVPGSPFDAVNYRGPGDDVAAAFFPDVYSYNFEPANKLILPLERGSVALFAEADLSERVRVYGNAMGVRYTASTALAPSPAGTGPNPLYPGLNVIGFTIPVTNPFIPPDLAALLASRTGNTPALAGAGAGEEFVYRFRTVAFGPRQSDNRSKVLNLLGGLVAEMPGGWRADAYAAFGRYERRETLGGLLSVRRMEQVLDSPTGGRDICDGGFNPFGVKFGEACRDFLQVSARFSTEVEQTNAVATVSGRVITLPAGPLEAVFGVEYRRVTYDFDPPAGLTPGDVAGFTPLSAVSGAVRFHELFAEAAVPLLRESPLAHELDLTLGYRRSHERTTGGVDAYKAELGWAPVPTARVRASYQRAVRAPDIFERFEPPVAFFARAVDPCAADNPARTAGVLALCRQQATALGFAPGAADNLTQFAPEVPTEQSGNPDLEPEVADSVTLGVVWRPAAGLSWAQDIVATLDGYDIRVEGAIDYLDPQIVLNACYNIGGGNPGLDPASPACRAFQRSSVDFSVAQVAAPRTNQAYLRTRGIDASLVFRTDLAEATGHGWAGALRSQVSVNRLLDFKEQASDLRARVDYAATIAGSGFGYQSLPRWKGLLDLEWTSDPFSLGVTGRYIGAMEHRLRRDGGDATATGAKAADYWDLRLSWALREGTVLRGGVFNLFDRQPEIFRPAVDANTDPSTYDVVGRRFWIGLSLRL